ncbi:hypothetical protein BN1708_015829 [Verticillium longisporum]|uniref:Four-carbon acid sugar kinase N-terminal domain-containing protein n=1 Tax=Verticillium longisporum TaxID=100787 RepID=A0A0G4M8T0_VERLO|nr:hypothetical protein BN1708_015829 [Verticillium longisporum]
MAAHPVLDLDTTLASLPPPVTQDIRAQVQAQLRAPSSQIPLLVALDDDPTGTQTCHNVNVLTVWDVPTLTAEFSLTPRGSGFFVLTNSRALHPAPARALLVEICTNLQAASSATGLPFEIVLRGDSTLRGHFPLEAEAATAALGPFDAWLLCPFFLQGGRYTVDNVHYVAEGARLVPAAQTPFAADATFGYASSDLRDYVAEKTAGAVPAAAVQSITLQTIREGGPDAVLAQLLALERGATPAAAAVVVVVNAAAESDVDVAATLPLLYRTGAAFVSARLGIKPIAPITAAQLQRSDQDAAAPWSSAAAGGGLIMAGSYVPKTTKQLDHLRRDAGAALTTVQVDVAALLASPASRRQETARVASAAEASVSRGHDTLVMTSRALVVGADGAASLDMGAVVASALVDVLRGLATRPRYVVAKGGITSSDMAAAGVPLWRCVEGGGKWPGVPGWRA